MALKFRLKSKDEAPAEVQHLYIERDGAWLLDVDGAADKGKIEEFRANNIALTNELKELKQRFEGIDPDEVRKLADEKRRIEEEKILNGGKAVQPGAAADAEREKLEKVVEHRIKGLRTDWERQVNTLTVERDALNSRLTAIQIDQGVLTAATKRGLRPTALIDITARARSVFKLVNGALRAFEADGQTVRYGRDGVTPMTLEEWVDLQVADAPHLFETSAGSGAAGNTSEGGAQRSVDNPFRNESWNLTEQMKLMKSDPRLAALLKGATEVRECDSGPVVPPS